MLLPTPPDLRVDERIEVAVEHGAGVTDLKCRPRVLNQLIGVQHVVAHLVVSAEASGVARSLELVHLVGGFLPSYLQQLGLAIDQPLVLFFGIVRPYKGLHDLIEALALLKQRGFDVARRTVVKYREAMGIGSSIQRRRHRKIAG